MIPGTSRQRRRDGGLALVLGTLALAAAVAGCDGGRTGAPASRDARPELALGRTPEHDYDPPEPGSYELPPLMPAADGAVLDLRGERRSLRRILAGRISVLSFVYTRCPDPSACPYATGVLRAIHGITRQDPELADNLQLLTLSFDPLFDRPATMEEYRERVGPAGGGAPWRFLTTAGWDELGPILGAYGQRIDRDRRPDDPSGPISHMLRVYLIDRAGQVRNIYGTGLLDPRLVVTDVRTLLLEEERGARPADPNARS